MTLRASLVLGLVLLGGCVTSPPVSSNIRLDPAARPQCEQHCSALGMKMTAIVLYSNHAGCVCELPGPRASSTTQAASAVTAAGEILEEEESASTHAAESSAAASQRP